MQDAADDLPIIRPFLNPGHRSASAVRSAAIGCR
jgi:hypothetical protein